MQSFSLKNEHAPKSFKFASTSKKRMTEAAIPRRHLRFTIWKANEENWYFVLVSPISEDMNEFVAEKGVIEKLSASFFSSFLEWQMLEQKKGAELSKSDWDLIGKKP